MIREYSKNDKPKLLELLAFNTPEYFSEEEKEDYDKYLDNEVEKYYVFVRNNEIVAAGGINFGFDNGTAARISWDMVHPDMQGMGIGKELTNYRISEIKKAPQIKKIIVRTSQHVYGFYQNVGFMIERIEKDFWAQGFDLYQMEINLEGI